MHKKIADGIRVRSASKIPIQKPPKKSAASDKGAEELIIHPYVPTGNGGFTTWSSFPQALSEPIPSGQRTIMADVVRHASPRPYALWGMMAGMILIVGSGIVLSTVLSRATVRVKPKIEVVTIQNVSVIFDTAIFQPIPEQKTIPAEHLHFTEARTQEVGVSVVKYVEAHSHGIVTISNQYGIAPQRLIAQSRFLTPSGVLFRLANSLVVPGAVLEKGTLTPRSIDAELIADIPGEHANLSGPMRLKISGFQGTPKYDGFAVVAPNGFGGGFRGTKKVPSDMDMQGAQQAATKKVYDELKQQMQQKIPPGLRLVDGFQEIRIVKVALDDPRPLGEGIIDQGQQHDKLAVRAVAEGDALVFHEDDVIALLKGVLLPQDNTKVFVDNSVNLTYAVHTLNFDRGRADAMIQGSIKTKQPLTQVQRDDLATALANKKQGSVREFFNSRNDVVLSSLSVFPPWKSTLPSSAGRIQVVEEE
ncbi:MAG: hypothetical protein HY007_00190 [Candidatus Sungbacteria bacterium]|nr:hypothetical protein [Candidatus Sungbacteria bacterium]